MVLTAVYYLTVTYLCMFCILEANGQSKITAINCVNPDSTNGFCLDCESYSTCSTIHDPSSPFLCASGKSCEETSGFAICTSSVDIPACACPPTGDVIRADKYDNQKYFNCVNGVRKVLTCSGNDLFNPATDTCENYDGLLEICQNGVTSVARVTCTSYKHCYSDGTQSAVVSCKEGELFDTVQDKCVPYVPFTCADKTENKYYPDNHVCGQYHLCLNQAIEGDLGECPFDNVAGRQKVWNEDTQFCDLSPCTALVDCGLCQDDLQVIGIDCFRYYQCTANTEGTLDFVPVEHTCPAGYYFDSSTGYCTKTRPANC